jgi:hypothetical protein
MKRNHFIVGLILLIFFVISFLTNIIGPLVPDIIDSYDLSLTTVAVLPFAFFIAYGVMSIPSDPGHKDGMERKSSGNWYRNSKCMRHKKSIEDF